MTYQVKFDAGHKEVTAALRKMGWPFLDVARHRGFGCDLIVKHKDGYPILLELKNPGPPSSQKLTESEEQLRTMFPDFWRLAVDWPGVLAAIGLGA